MKHGTTRIIVGDARTALAEVPDGSCHCCITSPPYHGLRDYKAGADMIGLEATPEEHIENLLAVFREVWRCLRSDGVCFVNYGDAYVTQGGSGQSRHWDGRDKNTETQSHRTVPSNGLQYGDALMLPHRVAMALQAAGWIVRSQIIWAKALSFCPTYSGSCMPESLSGTRWERCRVKTADANLQGDPKQAAMGSRNAALNDAREHPERMSQFEACPGCPKCEANGGMVLRRGSWRPTSSYELVFMFAKQSGYWCDGEGVREAHSREWWTENVHAAPNPDRNDGGCTRGNTTGQPGRNLRSVWTINPQPFSEAHFATFPEALVTPMVKIGTSEKGACPECGAQWARVVETERSGPNRPAHYSCTDETAPHMNTRGSGGNTELRWKRETTSRTLGWRPTCSCGVTETVPPVCLDVFGGSGTTALVANRLGRDAIIVELNPEYAAMAKARIGKGLRPGTYRDETREEFAPLFDPEAR